MNKRTRVVVLVAAALAVMVGRAGAQDRLVHESKDAVTGATIRVYLTNGGPRIDVVTSSLQLRKQLVGDKVITSLAGPGQSLVIELSPRTFSVAGSQGRATATPGDERQIARARKLIAESPLAARAAALIGRMGFGNNPAIEPLLITTRALLLAARGDQSGTREMSEWARRTRMSTRVIKAAAGQKMTPTDCWNAYGEELVNAYTDYVDCVNNLHWYDPFGEKGCAVIYEVRILGAFTWYSGCVSLGGLIGK